MSVDIAGSCVAACIAFGLLLLSLCVAGVWCPALCGCWTARSSHRERIGSKRLSLPPPCACCDCSLTRLHCLCAVPIRTLHSRNHCAPTPRTSPTHPHSSSSHERHRSRGQCSAQSASPAALSRCCGAVWSDHTAARDVAVYPHACVLTRRDRIAALCIARFGCQYDYSVSTFSPNGRVFQVEYAAKAVEKSGSDDKQINTDRQLESGRNLAAIARYPSPCAAALLSFPFATVFHTPVSSAPLARGVDEDTTVIRIRKIQNHLLFHSFSCCSPFFLGLFFLLPRAHGIPLVY